MPATVLLVHGDRVWRKLLRTHLQDEGLGVIEAQGGREAVARTVEVRPDVLVIDLRMPEFDGFEVLRRLRGDGVAVSILVLADDAAEAEQLLAYRLGAIDCAPRPQSPRVLAAKIRAVALRHEGRSATPRQTAVGGVVVELDRRRVLVADAEVTLTRREFDLLAAFMEHPGWVFGRSQLLARCWGYDDPAADTRLVDMHVANLRRKLDAAGAPGILRTVRGVGYRLGETD